MSYWFLIVLGYVVGYANLCSCAVAYETSAVSNHLVYVIYSSYVKCEMIVFCRFEVPVICNVVN